VKILVTGSNGQLGSEISKISLNHNFDWIFLDRQNFDISNLRNIHANLDKISPNIIVNCAAYTSVDNAEDNFDSANIINNESINFIARWCSLNSCKLLHISTDYVYDENSTVPISEDYPTNPINNYGRTKLLGENACLKYNPISIIIRTSWLYSSFGNNFVKKMIRLMQKNNVLNVINDQISSPTYAADLAEVIISIIKYKKWIPGIYNYSNKGEVSWFDLANDIKFIYGFNNIIINSISSNNYSSKAKRPKYTLLDNSKINKTFDIKQLDYKDRLEKCLKILKNES
jgi:dTDP-4-dehydrorhamnose reductase